MSWDERLREIFPLNPEVYAIPFLCDSSGVLSSNDQVSDSPAILASVVVYTDGTNPVTVRVYDNPSAASGKILSQIVLSGADLMGGELNVMCMARNGLYVEISGTGGSALVRFIN